MRQTQRLLGRLRATESGNRRFAWGFSVLAGLGPAIYAAPDRRDFAAWLHRSDLSGSIRSRCSRRGSRRLDGAGRGWPGQARPGRRCLHGSANLQLTLQEWESLAFFRIYGRLSFLESTVRSKLEVCHGNLVLASPRRRVKFSGRGQVFQQNGVATYAVRKFSPRFPP
jgi:hypothetical protein